MTKRLARTDILGLASFCVAVLSCGPHIRELPSLEWDLPRDVVGVRWARQMVADEFLYYRRQEWASAAFAPDGAIFIGSSGGQFVCFEADGTKRWAVPLDGAVSSTPLFDYERQTVYFGADDGRMYGVDAQLGTVRWRYQTEGVILARPTLGEGLLLFSSTEDRVYAVDAQTGKWKWQYQAERPEGFTVHGHAGIAVQGSIAYTGFSDGTAVALKVATGEVAWRRALGGNAERYVDVDATPLIEDNILYTASYSNGIFALDRDTGSVQWSIPVEGASSLTPGREFLFFAAPRLGIVAIDRQGTKQWRQALGEGIPTTPVAVADDILLVTTSEAGLFIAGQTDGQLLQYFDPGGGISAPAASDEQTITVLSNRGRLYTFNLN